MEKNKYFCDKCNKTHYYSSEAGKKHRGYAVLLTKKQKNIRKRKVKIYSLMCNYPRKIGHITNIFEKKLDGHEIKIQGEKEKYVYFKSYYSHEEAKEVSKRLSDKSIYNIPARTLKRKKDGKTISRVYINPYREYDNRLAKKIKVLGPSRLKKILRGHNW